MPISIKMKKKKKLDEGNNKIPKFEIIINDQKEKCEKKEININIANKLEKSQNEKMKQYKEKKEHIFVAFTTRKKTKAKENVNTNKNKPKFVISHYEDMGCENNNNMKTIDENTKKDIIANNKSKENQNEMLEQYREEKETIFEIITMHNENNSCDKNSVINYQGNDDSSNNYPTFGNNNNNELENNNSKYIIYIIKFNFS